LHTIRITQHNGILIDHQKDDSGVIIDSRIIDNKPTIYIQIPDGLHLKLPLQMLNVLEQGQNLQTKALIKLGQDSKVQFIHCDDSFGTQSTNSVNTIDVFLAANACFDYYKMENINNDSSIKTDVNFHLSQNSQLTTYGFSLNGKQICNTLNIFLNEPHAQADLNGLYLMDKQQSVETIINVFHKAQMCRSNQLFKGILDDAARANFLGHVYVDYGSRGTLAMQTNKNILLTDKAKVNTRPFLEIYNDDVKCSHGATIGQLDDDALFYLRSRGISFPSARMLLMYAFCQEVLASCGIAPLKESLEQIIKMRLQGELLACANCVFQCPAAKS
jgi:Fe-S cluster assembly protein SufD